MPYSPDLQQHDPLLHGDHVHLKLYWQLTYEKPASRPAFGCATALEARPDDFGQPEMPLLLILSRQMNYSNLVRAIEPSVKLKDWPEKAQEL